MDLPGSELAHEARGFFDGFDLTITLLFSAEMITLLFALGPYSYLSSAWNLLDLLVLVVSWLSLLLADAHHLSLLRCFRSLRVLKLASHLEGVRVVVHSLYLSLAAVGNVFIVFFIFLAIFGILGMQLFGGRLSFCDEVLPSPPFLP